MRGIKLSLKDLKNPGILKKALNGAKVTTLGTVGAVFGYVGAVVIKKHIN